MADHDHKDALERTEHGALNRADVEAATKSLWIVVRCFSQRCASIVTLPIGPEVWRDERTLQRALSQHEGAAWKAEGGWTVQGANVRRTFQPSVTGWTLLCPACTRAMETRNTNIVNTLAKKVIV